jgi:Mn-dependent DtxR family transcriptional regulator
LWISGFEWIYPASNEDMETSFNDIQKHLDFTAGNLSVQLNKLADAKYVKSRDQKLVEGHCVASNTDSKIERE